MNSQKIFSVCKCFRNIGYCKFGAFCFFRHVVKKDPEIEKLKAENKEMMEKLRKLEELLLEKDDQIKMIIKTMQDTGRKDSKDEYETEKSFKCEKCNFQTNSQSGLKIHNKKKHTLVNKETYPKKCDLCEKEVYNASEMRKHITSHSYTYSKFKCGKCEFVGANNNNGCAYWKTSF